MQCKNCQAEVPEGASFCAQCGATVSSSDPAGSPAAEGPAEPAAAVTAGQAPAEPEAAGEATPSPEPGLQAESPKERFERAAQQKRESGDEAAKEVTVWEGSYSPKAMYGHFLAGLAVSVVLAVILFKWRPFGQALLWWIIASVVIEAALMVWLGIRKLSVRYELTTQRLIHQKGLLSRTTDRIELIDIDDVTYRQGLVQRMLGVGTILITSSDRTHPQLEMPGIEPVRDVAGKIDDLRRDERRRRSLHIEAI